MFNKVNVACYLACRWLIERNPSLSFNPIIKRILEYCFQDWVNWKTADTMADVDRQAEQLQKQWKDEENQAILAKAKEMFPDAEVSLHDANTGAVFIEHPADESEAQRLLGGDMEIKSPWTLSPEKNDF